MLIILYNYRLSILDFSKVSTDITISGHHLGAPFHIEWLGRVRRTHTTIIGRTVNHSTSFAKIIN